MEEDWEEDEAISGGRLLLADEGRGAGDSGSGLGVTRKPEVKGTDPASFPARPFRIL